MRRCASQTASPGRGVDKPHSLERTFSRIFVNLALPTKRDVSTATVLFSRRLAMQMTAAAPGGEAAEEERREVSLNHQLVPCVRFSEAERCVI